MYNTWLSVFAIILGTIGTIKAILAILKMRLKDVIYERTSIGEDTKELSLLQQVYDARVGFVFVILSSGVQVFKDLYKGITCRTFWSAIITIIFVSIIWWILMFILYKKERITLINAMPEEIRKYIK